MNNLPEWIEDNKFQIGMGVLGLVLIGFGAWQSIGKQIIEDSKVEVISSFNNEADESKANIIVDVSGAVEKPGVYEFESDARINDALMRAGGLSPEADRSYVSRGINLAEKIIDGAKIYIPFKDEPLYTGGGETGYSKVYGSSVVSINSASISELDSLWGIGESRARQIIDNRPYSNIEELKSKASIPSNVIEANEGIISL